MNSELYCISSLIAVATALDLSPHYYHETATYRSSQKGLGLEDTQGLNVGVTLLALDKMRAADSKWKNWRLRKSVQFLAKKYM